MTKDEMKTDESKHIINLVIKDKLKKEAEELIQRFEMANSMNCFMQLTPDRKQIGEMLVMITEPREKRIEALEKENKNLNRQLSDIIECFQSSSSGDDFEMAESAREIMEVLGMSCYRHGEVKSKLSEAKEIIKKLTEFANLEIEYDPEYPEEHTKSWNELCKRAVDFIKE